MDPISTGRRGWGRRIAVLAPVVVVALGAALVSSVPASARTTPPHAPVGNFLTSTNATAGQFCRDGKPLSRTRTPIFGVSKGTPAYNANRPNLMATFEVAPIGQPALASGTVAFGVGPAKFQVPSGLLGEGDYQFRVRAVDGGQVSAWLPWCVFTVDTVNIPTPAVPINLRVSSYPYAGFQYCGGTVPVIYAAYDSSATFAATRGRFEPTPNPNLVGRFEVARPDRESLTTVGNLNLVSFPSGSFTPGMHRFRVQAEEGTVVSDWSPWCDFLVE